MAVKTFGRGLAIKASKKGANGNFANFSLRSGMPEKGRIRAITLYLGREGTGNPHVWGMIWDGPSGAILAQSTPQDVSNTVTGYAQLAAWRFEFPDKPMIDAYRDIRIGYAKISNVANQYLWVGLTGYPDGQENGINIDYTSGITQTSPGLMTNVTNIANTGMYAVVEYETGGVVKVFNGSDWNTVRTPKVWDGSNWVSFPLAKVWNGSAWVESTS